MFDISWSEILVMAAVAIIVYGPEDLPKALRGLGRLIRQLKRYTGAVHKTIDNIMEEDELNQIVRDLNKTGDTENVLSDERYDEKGFDEDDINQEVGYDKKTDRI